MADHDHTPRNGEGPGDQARPDATTNAGSECTPEPCVERAESDPGPTSSVEDVGLEHPDSTTARTVWVTIFDTYDEQVGKRFKGTFNQWCQYLERAPAAPPDQTKDRLNGFCPAVFRGDQKENERVESVDMLVTEYDNEEWVTTDEIDPKTGKKKREKRPIPPERRTTIDAALALWDGYSRAVYTSWSHTPEHPKFRVLVETSRPMAADEFERVWRWMRARAAQAGHVIDVATKNPSRFWFLPRRREGRDFIFRRIEGKPLDINAILKEVQPESPPQKSEWRANTRLAAYIQELEASIDMQHLVESDGLQLLPHGSTKAAFSPFRDDGNKASFVVYTDHAFDFVTEEYYGPIRYWKERHGLSFWDTLDALAEKKGFDKFVRADANKPVPVNPQPLVDAFLALEPVPTGDERTKLLRSICALIATQDETNWPTWTKPLAKKCGVTVGVINKTVREAVKTAKAAAQDTSTADAGYEVVDGRLCAVRHVEGGGTVSDPLGNFDAWIAEVVTHDDGAEKTKKFLVAGRLAGGDGLPPVEVPAEEFDAMNWVTPGWNGRAIIHPGRGTKDTLRAAILSRSKHTEATVYGDLGWHPIDGQRAYLHAGGAIGGQGDIRVQVPDELSRFVLPPDTDDREALRLAVRRSMLFLNAAPPEVTYPLYCSIWVAPLLDFIPFNTTVTLIGKTQAMKTSLALEVQRHFGRFDNDQNLPLNFEASPTAVELILHAAKDNVVVMDDYYPRKNQRDAEKQKVLADRTIRSVGNRSTRKRATANIQLRVSRPPRGIVLMTCEEDPAPASEGESAAGRTLKVFLQKGAVNKEYLTTMQTQGNHALVMRKYLQALVAAKKDAVIARHAKIRDGFRAQGLSDRMPDVLASMLVGFELFIWGIAASFYDESACMGKLKQAKDVLLGLAKAQDAVAKADEPDLRYLETIKDALVSGRARLVSPEQSLQHSPTCRDIGWYDEKQVYLHPKETHILVTEVMRAAGEYNPWKLTTIYDQLVHRGYASPRNDPDHLGTRRGPFGGVRVYVIELPRALFEDVRLESPTGDPDQDFTSSDIDAHLDLTTKAPIETLPN